MNKLVSQANLDGNIIRDNEQYVVTDNRLLDNLCLSKTELRPEQATGGHSHDGLDEVYFFVEGKGRIQIGDETQDVEAGDIALIPGGDFHKVFNDSKEDMLVFVCVFQSYEREDQ